MSEIMGGGWEPQILEMETESLDGDSHSLWRLQLRLNVLYIEVSLMCNDWIALSPPKERLRGYWSEREALLAKVQRRAMALLQRQGRDLLQAHGEVLELLAALDESLQARWDEHESEKRPLPHLSGIMSLDAAYSGLHPVTYSVSRSRAASFGSV